ncbi:aminoglycoside phosphotransferase [Pseudonocardiaceae bacterium YIM PH 21723]|nr:aminoglycoside phosphotransferase [Pseudonocardiaceae bacterium YIM PH 21723]
MVSEPIPGWDSIVSLVDGRWIHRSPSRPDVVDRLLGEVRLLPHLAPHLPLPIPLPQILQEDPLIVRHERVPGEPLAEASSAAGQQLGRFVAQLHSLEVDVYGVPRAPYRQEDVDALRTGVLPLLPAERLGAAGRLLDRILLAPMNTLVHGDLGPEHVLAEDGTLSGIIDWSDAHLGDRAMDLAWPLFGTTPEFATGFTTTYGRISENTLGRARDWYRLGPWYDVLHSHENGDRDELRDGLAGVLNRL